MSASDPENFFVNLNNASNAIVSDGQGTGTINDNDADISINDVSNNEGNLAKGKKNSGNPQLKDFVFTITLSNAVGHTVTVSYATANGTATVADGDYHADNGLVTFLPGDVSQTVVVTVVGDNDQEPDETFSVLLSSPQGANLGDASGTGTILDDDTKGGGKGGGNGKPKAPAEIELQDPIWWFQGPPSHAGEHDHVGEHSEHFGLPNETHGHTLTDLSSAAFAALGSVSSMSLLDGRANTHRTDDSSEAADRVLAELEWWVAPAQTQTAPIISDRSESVDIEADLEESAFDEVLVDSIVDNLTDDLSGLP